MMTFVMMTISFTVALLLASGIALFLVTRPKVMRWYMKRSYELTQKLTEELFNETEDL